ncbi:pyridoxal 5'-phosphate synthase glutaminase subunit PdxT, partial [Streptomyces sp. NPDC058642]|uniref:pyridoxal 5'-phosphate synthase glutaminase subunit PdxT n=1 Tax=Streptomyces sp. NPDC058642 TaxID=3346572 RepID=UPI003648454F
MSNEAPVIGVLALQGDVREHLIALAAADAVARPVRRPEELAEIDGLVIPGGESTTISKLAVLFGVMEPLRARVRAGMPVYGTCAGMIMLADKILDPRSGQETIGGIDMIVRRNAFGRQNESFEATVDVEGVEGDAVEERTAGALARRARKALDDRRVLTERSERQRDEV